MGTASLPRISNDDGKSPDPSLSVKIRVQLPDSPGPSAKKIYQHKLRQISRVGEISLAIGHGRHLFYKVDQVIVAGQHECIDHNSSFATSLYFLESFGHD